MNIVASNRAASAKLVNASTIAAKEYGRIGIRMMLGDAFGSGAYLHGLHGIAQQGVSARSPSVD
jgi:hypothetical protein